MILEVALSVLVLLGGFFAFVAGLGLLRLRDVPTRMHATTKAGIPASGLVLLAVAIGIGGAPVVARAVLIVLFLLLTAPVVARLIGRAALRPGGAARPPTKIDRTAAGEPGVRGG